MTRRLGSGTAVTMGFTAVLVLISNRIPWLWGSTLMVSSQADELAALESDVKCAERVACDLADTGEALSSVCALVRVALMPAATSAAVSNHL